MTAPSHVQLQQGPQIHINMTKPSTMSTRNMSLEVETHQDWRSNPHNPQNWPNARKYSVILLISLTNVTASVCSTAFEPALPTMMEDLHSNSDSVSSLFITMFLLGYVLGPLLIAPASKLYGRTVVLWPSYMLLMLTLAVCASATNLAVFLVIRCLMGFAANAFVIVGPAIVADIIPPEQRGLALSILSSGPVLRPTLGPPLGGIIIQNLGWRWVFWIALVLLGVLSLVSIFVLRETYSPLVQWHHQHASTSHQNTKSSLPSLPLIKSASAISSDAVLRAAFTRPLKLFFFTPIIPLLAVYGSISYSYLNVLFATLGIVFQDRSHFNASKSGLTYLGMTAGFVAALISTGLIADRLARWLVVRRATREVRGCAEPPMENVMRNHQSAPSTQATLPLPEDRLPLAIAGSILIIPSIFMYGFTLASSLHWIVPIMATAIIACSSVWTFMGIQMFIVDAYGIYAASATGAVSIFRSICATVIPLAANPAYHRWGYKWGNAIFAFVCVPFVPVAFGLLIWGQTLRKRSKVKL